MLFGKKLQAVTADDIQAVIENGVREDRHIDYKRSLPDKTKDNDRKELLADVSAFANTSGGDILFGVDEERNEKGEPTGIPKEIVPLDRNTLDGEERRIAQVLATGLDPPLVPSPSFKEVMTPVGPVLLLRIEKSWAAPHMVKETSKFYSRPGGSKLPMDTTSLRAAFLQGQSFGEFVRSFHEERRRPRLPHSMHGPERLCVHVVPFSALIPVVIPVTKLDRVWPLVKGRPGWNQRWNADGCLRIATVGDKLDSYVQFFRNGVVEYVKHVSGRTQDEDGELESLGILDGHEIEDHVRHAVRRFGGAVMAAGANGPVGVIATLSGVSGKNLAGRASPSPNFTFDRPDVTLSDVVVDDVAGPEIALRPFFDQLWQACSYEGSQSYHADGTWGRSVGILDEQQQR